MSKKTVTYSWQDKASYSWQDSKLLLLTPLGSLLVLYGFTASWFAYPNASGWEIALDFASKDLILLSGVAPGAPALLWLVPCTALLLLGCGIMRLFWAHLRWGRIWSLFLVGVSLVLMSSFCFPLFPPETLQHLRGGDLQVGFWLTGGALLLSALGLLIPDPTQWIMKADQQPAPDTRMSRRHALTSVVNLSGLLVVGSAVGLDLGWLTHPYVTRRQVLSIVGSHYSSLDGMRKLVWSSDNTSLVECLSGVLHSWKIATGQVMQTYISPPSPNGNIVGETDKSFNNIALSPDGRWIAAAVNADGVSIWEAASGHFVQRFAPVERNPILSEFYGGVAWSPDGTALVTSKFISENQAVLFVLRASDLKPLATYPLSDTARTMAWSGDGRMLAVITDQVDVWDISRGKKIWTYQPPRYSVSSETEKFRMSVSDVAWASDSRRLAISLSAGIPGDGFAGQPSPVLIWDIAANRQICSCQGHWGSSNGLAWSPDDSRIAAAGSDWTVQIWNAQTGAQLLTYQGHRDTVWSVAWSPDGNFLASGSADHTIQIWEAPRL
ncbi:hypothetical protein KSC_068130 [Ktedonobacter sp. SOSP1-52]|uniref:WD40 repeat domain-containing protein n=1 Tax=Ktedonobacter sp. SOSP1-52 TaxID=2778366 RepID=UPI0019166A45|nr:hypothetical protein [Ktedonobacter sp. SOSP1-52]GHO67921.1 hypothetical protein KSC_068130 [Ktedonobacter sp. SOSP1-52]